MNSISYNAFYLSFLLYWAVVQEVSIELYLSYEFFSYDRHDRYNDMETRLKGSWVSRSSRFTCPETDFNNGVECWRYWVGGKRKSYLTQLARRRLVHSAAEKKINTLIVLLLNAWLQWRNIVNFAIKESENWDLMMCMYWSDVASKFAFGEVFFQKLTCKWKHHREKLVILEAEQI